MCNYRKHKWSSGRIVACHAIDPGSIPGLCKFFFPAYLHSNNFSIICNWEEQMLKLIMMMKILIEKKAIIKRKIKKEQKTESFDLRDEEE